MIFLCIIVLLICGEVPKRLKGLASNTSRRRITVRGFKSLLLRHVGTSYARSDFLFHKKSDTRSTVPPFPKKVTLRLRCSLVNALATFRLATNLFRVARGFEYPFKKILGVHFETPSHVGMDYAPFKIPGRMVGDFLYRSVIPPLGKKSRLLRLCPCKRGHNASAALPTFCGIREGSNTLPKNFRGSF